MATFFGPNDNDVNRTAKSDKTRAPKVTDSTTTLGKTSKYAPVQFIEPEKVMRGGEEGQPPRPGMATRAPLQFGPSGQKVTPTLSQRFGENIGAPAAGMVLQFDPVSQLSQGRYNIGGALDPLIRAYQDYKWYLTGGPPPSIATPASEAVRAAQEATPEWARRVPEFFMAGEMGRGGHVAPTPEQLTRSVPSYAGEPMPRAPVVQTPMREILARASQPEPSPIARNIAAQVPREPMLAKPVLEQPATPKTPAPLTEAQAREVLARKQRENEALIASRARTPEQIAADEGISLEAAQRRVTRFTSRARDRAPEYRHHREFKPGIMDRFPDMTRMSPGSREAAMNRTSQKARMVDIAKREYELAKEASEGLPAKERHTALKDAAKAFQEGIEKATAPKVKEERTKYAWPAIARNTYGVEWNKLGPVEQQELMRKYYRKLEAERRKEERAASPGQVGKPPTKQKLIPGVGYDKSRAAKIKGPPGAKHHREFEPGIMDRFPDMTRMSPGSRESAVSKRQKANQRAQLVQETPQLREALTNASTIRDVQPIIDRLKNSPALEQPQQKYFQKLATYLLNPSFATGAYYKLTNGEINKPVPISDLFEVYKREIESAPKEALERRKGTVFYEKDLRSLTRHLYTYGRRIGEKFEEVPSMPAPWVIDEARQEVRLSPYIPDAAGTLDLADTLPPEQGTRLAASLPKPERQGPPLIGGRQPREAAHEKTFTDLFIEKAKRFITDERGAGPIGPRGKKRKGKIITRGAIGPKQPVPQAYGAPRSSGMRPVAGPRGGKVPPSAPSRALKGMAPVSKNPLKNAFHELQAYLSPSTASPGARQAHQIVRAAVGESRRFFVQEAAKLDAYRKQINALDDVTKKMIRDYIQGYRDVVPALNNINADWVSFVKALKDTNERIVKRFQALPAFKQKEFQEDYLSQYWKEGMRDRKKMSVKGHFMEKKYATYREGEAAGLHAKFDDPIEIQFQYMKDVFNFFAKEDSLEEMLKLDYAKRLGNYQREPIGTTLLKHVGRRRIYAAEDVARVWENMWGPGIHEHTDMGKLYLGTIRALNASTGFVLGLSGYHALNIAHGAIELNVQNAVKSLDAGRPWSAVKQLAGAPGAPVFLYRKGSVLHDVFTGKATASSIRESKIASLLAQSNMTVAEFEPIYRASGHMNWVEAYKVGLLGREFGETVKGLNPRKPLSAVGNTYSLMARTLDSVMHPLFAHLIPRVKAGAFYEKLNRFMDENPQATDEELVREAQRAADSIENVEGLMTQQNVMVAPLLKQTANLLLMAPGWTFGALRAYGQGTVDLGRYAAKAATGRKEPLSQNAAYVLAAAITTSAMAAALQFFMSGKPPGSPRDLIAPRTGGQNPDGSEERLLLPGNFKDLLGYYHDPVMELSNKVRPPWRAAREELVNKQDYRGVPVRNVNDPLSRQIEQAAGHILRTIGEPIALQQSGTATAGSAIPGALRGTLGVRPMGQWLANPEKTARQEHKAARKAWARKLFFERRDQARRQPSTKPIFFGTTQTGRKHPTFFAH